MGNILCGDIIKEPAFKLYKFDITNNRSEVFLTGKKRERGTLIPENKKITIIGFSKKFKISKKINVQSVFKYSLFTTYQ